MDLEPQYRGTLSEQTVLTSEGDHPTLRKSDHEAWLAASSAVRKALGGLRSEKFSARLLQGAIPSTLALHARVGEGLWAAQTLHHGVRATRYEHDGSYMATYTHEADLLLLPRGVYNLQESTPVVVRSLLCNSFAGGDSHVSAKHQVRVMGDAARAFSQDKSVGVLVGHFTKPGLRSLPQLLHENPSVHLLVCPLTQSGAAALDADEPAIDVKAVAALSGLQAADSTGRLFMIGQERDLLASL